MNNYQPNNRPQDAPNFGAHGPQFVPPPPKRPMGKGKKTMLIIFGVIGALFVAALLLPNGQDNVTPTSTPSQKVDKVPSPVISTTKPVEPARPKFTKSQEQAIRSAEQYLQLKGFSRAGLIQQLSSEYGEGFSKADATFAVDHIDVDWNEQAVRAAKSYLELKGFSRNGLIQQLESPYGDQFTHAQAVYGVNGAGL